MSLVPPIIMCISDVALASALALNAQRISFGRNPAAWSRLALLEHQQLLRG
jgi:hypothetical protein